MTQFKSRAYGFVSVKAINSNYNADFSGAPRTLPSGQVYATDKALKYTIRNFIRNVYTDQTVLYFKRLNSDMNPLSLADAYATVFPKHKDLDAKKKDTKSIVIKDILSCIDVRLFGSTFAKKAKGGNIALSLHGPVQINHGVNIWNEGNIFAEQITSPFNSKEDSSNEQTTIGRQQKLEEGHYIHHFSINPKNIEEVASHGQEGTQVLSQNDIELLKEALRKGITYYDSAAKAGCENEILFYVQLNENSRLVLPNFTEMVKMSDSKKDGKRYFDLSDIAEELAKHSSEIEACEIYYNPQTTVIENLPAGCTVNQL
nr:type I CRISPR-associated protein Cas7 [uncultured Marinifilum sp.]